MRMGIRTKLNLSILSAVFIVLAFLVFFFSINLRQKTESNSFKLHDNISSEISSKVVASINVDLGMTRALAASYEGNIGRSMDELKLIYKNFLEQVIKRNPNYLAFWISLELQEIDPSYSKDYGRVTWLYDRLDGELKFREEKRDMDVNELSPQYIGIKRDKRESLIDPYWYKARYEGATQDSLMEATVGVPVFNGDEVIGLAGIDFTLQQLQSLSYYLHENDTLRSMIISNDGQIVTNEDSKTIGQKIDNLDLFGGQNDKIMRAIQRGRHFTEIIPTTEGEKYFSFHPIQMGNSNTPWSVCVSIPLKVIMDEANRVFWRSIIIGFLGLFLLGFIIYVFSNRLIKPIEATTRQLGKFAEGKINEVENLGATSNDEIGAMTAAMNMLNQRFQAIAAFAQTIGDGNLSAKYPYSTDDDVLGTALRRMQKNLIKLDVNNQQQDWIKSGLNGINEQIRGDIDFADMVKQMISYLAKYLNASVGAIYVADDSRHELRLAAGYAFTKRKELNARIEYGEGLVGQCFLEKETIILTDVPEDYFPIKSATGSTAPKNIIVVPCLFNQQPLAVIELGSLNEFSELELNFLDSAAAIIAIGLNTAAAKEKMKVLLAQTLEQKEELQAQEEELREANKELEKQTESLRESEAHLQAQQEELRVTNQELEKNAQMLEEQSERINEKNKELEITRKEIEKKAEELARASKYKSEFLANMSHELRTPLNSMLILSQSLADNSEGNLKEDEVESANIIYKSGKDLLNLINEVLDLSKIEAGKMIINSDEIEVSTIAENIHRLFKSAVTDKGLEFNLEIKPDVPKTIISDQMRIEQVIKNLLSNSVKFTQKGSIGLRFFNASKELTPVREDLKNKTILGISVEDSGIGISEEKQKLIFEAFQQEDGSTSRKYGGTGLGLSISKELAAILGGELQLKSEQGRGSTFTLLLPAVHEGKQATIESEEWNTDEKSVPQSPKITVEISEEKPLEVSSVSSFVPDDLDLIQDGDQTILIIEDDPEFAKILVNQCHKKGFKCLTSGTGENGIWLAREFAPSAIILDIKLPGIDGWEVLDRIKKDPQTRHIPVHMMSASEETIEAYQKGAIGFLTKPVSADDLQSAFGKIGGFIDKRMKKLLIVEDDAQMRKTIQMVIKGADLSISEVSTGQECLKEISENSYDCVILDLGLPDMDGFGLLKKIEELKLESLPPIIVYTGRELSKEQNTELQKYTKSIIIKGVKSEERLLDETALFLHRVVDDLNEKQKKMLKKLHNGENLFQEKKVLVVDDDMRNIFALTRIFEEKGMEVIKAENGRKAIEMLMANPDTNIVLMDIMMPEMDGYESMKEIRKLSEYTELPIIALTAKAMKEDKQKCLDAGASDYITKPVDVPKLLSLMRVWLYK